MAAELPVIVTGEGAAMDFCSEETAYLLPARKGRLSEKSIGGVHTVDYPWLFEPDIEVLVKLLKHVREHRAEAAEKARKARSHVLTSLTWDNAAQRVQERLTLLRDRPVLRHAERRPATMEGGTTVHVTKHHSSVDPGLCRVRELDLSGRMTEAEEVLAALAHHYPDNPRVPLEHVRLLVGAKQFERASAMIAGTPLSLKVDPEWLELTAECTEGMGEPGSADEFARRILERSPRSARALALRGRVAALKGNSEEAIRFFRAAMEADPGAGEPRALLGSLLLRNGDDEGGLTLLEEGFGMSPLNGDLLLSYVEAARTAGYMERAAERVGEAVRRHPGSKRLRYFHAEILAGLERLEESLHVVLGCMADFGLDDEALVFALKLRVLVGPKEIPPETLSGTTVSACMIIRNEEQYLPRCLWSVLPVVHELIVLDTGSTDRSEEIAAAYGARVFRAEWNNDFSSARNASMEPASGDWILVIDGDEVISATDLEEVRGLTARPGRTPAAYSFVTRNYLKPMDVIGWVANDGTYHEEAGTGWIPSEKARLFPRRADVRFEHPVHELAEASLKRARIPIIKVAVPIHHYGKLDAARTREKAEQYLQLGRKKLAEKGMSDLGALFELAYQENDLGHHREALRLYERILQLNGSIPKVHFGIASNLIALQRYEDAVRPLTKSIGLDPSLKEAYVQLALVYLCLGRIEPATAAAEQLNDLGLDYPPGTALLAAVRFAKGDRAGGWQALAVLDRKRMSYSQYFQEFARFLNREGKSGIAVNILEPFAESDSTQEDIALLLVDCYRDLALSRTVPGKPVMGG
jgi:glycosyltransferase involved in cell wall biosynthesis